MTTLDLAQQQLKQFYHPDASHVEEVELPPLHVLTLPGHGSPGSELHLAACGVLFSLSYTIKFLLEQQHPGLDYTLMPLEGLWWTGDNTSWQEAEDANRFWKLLMVQPDDVSEALVEQAKNVVKQKVPSALLSDVQFERFHEGRAAQLLHLGPYTDEERTVAQIFAWIKEHGGTSIGTHHEIYLDDASRTPPERLRTILRYPFS